MDNDIDNDNNDGDDDNANINDNINDGQSNLFWTALLASTKLFNHHQ